MGIIIKKAIKNLEARRNAIIEARVYLQEILGTPIHCKADGYIVALAAKALVALDKASTIRNPELLESK